MKRVIALLAGLAGLAERKRSAAELIAPHETTTTSAEYVSCAPFRSTWTFVTSRPDALVSRRDTYASVTSVTFGCVRAGSTQIT